MSNWFQTGETEASQFSGVYETMQLSHLWNNLFTLVWLHSAGPAASVALSLYLSLSLSFTLASLHCYTLWFTLRSPFSQAWHTPWIGYASTKIWWTCLFINSKIVQWQLSLFKPSIFWDDGEQHPPLHRKKRNACNKEKKKCSLGKTSNAQNGLALYTTLFPLL